jgi:hypothetical protein
MGSLDPCGQDACSEWSNYQHGCFWQAQDREDDVGNNYFAAKSAIFARF